MLTKDTRIIIKRFIASIKRNCSLKNASPELKLYKYPYKPALIIALLIWNQNPLELFNKAISLENLDHPVLRIYYELITNSRLFFNYLCNQNGKKD